MQLKSVSNGLMMMGLDEDLVRKVMELGYPREFVVSSVEGNEMNDAATVYSLLEKAKMARAFM